MLSWLRSSKRLLNQATTQAGPPVDDHGSVWRNSTANRPLAPRVPLQLSQLMGKRNSVAPIGASEIFLRPASPRVEHPGLFSDAPGRGSNSESMLQPTRCRRSTFNPGFQETDLGRSQFLWLNGNGDFCVSVLVRARCWTMSGAMRTGVAVRREQTTAAGPKLINEMSSQGGMVWSPTLSIGC